MKAAIAIGLVTLLVGAGAGLAARGQDSARVTYERARALEAASGNAAEVIKLYEQVIAAAEKTEPALAEAARARIAVLNPSRPDQPADRRVFVSESFLPSSVSANGAAVVGLNSDLGLEWRNLITGESRVLVAASAAATPMFPVLSADARWVAYGTFASGPSPRAVGLAVIGTEAGARPRMLMSMSAGPTFVPAGWSPDGREILVGHGTASNTTDGGERPQNLDWVSVVDGRVRTISTFPLARNPGGFALSQDGRWIAYAVSPESPRSQLETHIHVLSQDGASDSAVVTMAGSNAQPTWAPDNRHLFFISDRSGPGLWSIVVAEGSAAGEPTLVRAGISRGLVGMSSGGHLYYTRRTVDEVATVVVDSAKTKPALTQTFTGDGAAISPDGQSVAFIRYLAPRDGAKPRPHELTVRDLNTGLERGYSLPDGGIDRQSPIRWRPDSSALVVFVIGPGGAERGGTFIEVDVKTGTVRPIVPRDTEAHRRSNSGAMSADGKTMFMAVRRDGGSVTDVVAVDVRSHLERLVVHFPVPGLPAVMATGAGGELGPELTLSSDEKSLAILTMEAPQLSHLYIIATDGSGYREVPNSASLIGPASWLPDQQTILTGVTDRSGAIGRRTYIDGRASEPLSLDLSQLAGRTPLPKFKSVGAATFSADGLRMAFLGGSTPETEFIALEHVMTLVR